MRRWTRELPGDGAGGLDALAAAPDRVFAVARGALLLLDAATGELEATLGGGR